MSLDGVVDAASMQQWFNPYHSDERAKYIQDTIHGCDTMLYGRVTYEMLYPYWSALKNNEMGVAEKLNTVEKYVVSTSLKDAAWQNTTIISKDVIPAIQSLKEQPGGNILVQGSVTLTNALLKAGLVDELKLLVHPYIAGNGKKLFDGEVTSALQLVNSRQLEQGVTLLQYKPV